MESFLLSIDQLRARSGGKWKMYPSDVLPAFVADMDFRVAPSVQAAVERFTEKNDYGYGQMTDTVALFAAFSEWMARRHNWRPDPTLTHAQTYVVQGLLATIVAFSEPGDGVIVQTPIYPPFLRYTGESGRRVIENPLVHDGDRFVLDVEGLDKAAAQATMIPQGKIRQEVPSTPPGWAQPHWRRRHSQPDDHQRRDPRGPRLPGRDAHSDGNN